MAEKVVLRIGVWTENGIIIRRDSEKEPYPQTYTPKTADEAQAVLNLARQLHSGVASGCFWGTQGEKAENDLVAQLRTKILS